MARKQHRAILLQDVDHLGARGDVVSVKSGYLRNYLVPRRLAEQATEARINEIKQTESVRAKQQARTTEQAQEIARTLTTTILTIPVLAGAGDRLYGSVTPADIADEIWRARKIRSRRITGACRRHQNQVAVAIKRAREMALLPYTGA